MFVVRVVLVSLVLLSSACAQSEIAPITRDVWQEVVISVSNIERSAQFFQEIGGYEEKWRGALHASEIETWGLPVSATGEALLLGPGNRNEGLVRLVRFDNAGRKEPTRPGARSWDSGCYFSVMVRMKDMPGIYDDAIAMGWWTETPITQYTFGDSHLNIVVFQGPDGMQVQGYERLSLPLPEAFPDFERFSGPFNLMQMVRDRDAAYSFYTEVLGFDTFYKGKPYVSPEPVYMPLGIPINLTTSVRFRAGIVYPVEGELGRMETIEMMDLDGHDYADRCDAPNVGILAVRFPVDDLAEAAKTITARGWSMETSEASVQIEPYGDMKLFGVKTPDGANIHFFEDVQ